MADMIGIDDWKGLKNKFVIEDKANARRLANEDFQFSAVYLLDKFITKLGWIHREKQQSCPVFSM